jgi:hypothetical protein
MKNKSIEKRIDQLEEALNLKADKLPPPQIFFLATEGAWERYEAALQDPTLFKAPWAIYYSNEKDLKRMERLKKKYGKGKSH